MADAMYIWNEVTETWDPIPTIKGDGDMRHQDYDPDEDGVIGIAQGGTGAITAAAARTALGVDAAPLRFSDVEVDTTDWSADTTYDDYGFRATVPLTGVTATMFASVDVDPDTDPGDLSPSCDEYAGGIYLYAKTEPAAAVILKKVVCG